MSLQTVILDVVEERVRQDIQWGGPAHDDMHLEFEWMDLIHGQTGRLGNARERLIKIAALAVAAVEAYDRSPSWQRVS